jgi:formylglycine-generating enzyme required for sulfatase activity
MSVAVEDRNSVGMNLVGIESGSFLMGSTKDQIDQFMGPFPGSTGKWFDHEQPQHTVDHQSLTTSGVDDQSL